ncbi:acyl carrier protein [Candidatus Methylospira mobilis]|uniref:Acyl carrier protein n=1 Tax=Candidatus Methylospira mobilis TaxID=1808979 RepID=A0A5Q0BLC3_9GAMM|nr:acyl carrier protein [Candidatus Methylospira mobilis]QFY43922.1 acyl carrier protein [Candidatus Methylospira mobilis]WNV04925.1 hypothetical protein RP726_00575 [Candidatus Methylospira mobilis]
MRSASSGAGSLSTISLFLGAIAYPWLVHQTLTGPLTLRPLYGYASVISMTLPAVLLGWRSRYRLPILCGGFTLGFFFYGHQAWLIKHIDWFYLLEYSAFNSILCLGFGRTLTAGQTPMVTQFATRIRGAVTPDIAVYTRAVTLAWTVFFGILVLVSLMLFLLGSHYNWSLFATTLTPALVCLMFAIEYLIRLRQLPRIKHDGIISMLQTLLSRT